MEIPKIKYFLKEHKRFLISAHASPEGDSLGAQLAFSFVLKSMGKFCEIINSDRYPKEYAFLPGVEKIRTRPKNKKYDAVIVLDCSDLSRVGKALNFLDKRLPILNIDHHICNDYFGSINVVDIGASSTCEILYLLFKKLNIKINRNIAICLYTGIVTDTGSFRYTNTKARTHLVAYQLLNWGIDAPQIFRNIYENLTFADSKLINHILLNVKTDSTGRIAWANVTKDMLKKYKPQIDLSDNVLNFIRSLKGVDVSLIFREINNEEKDIRVNLRSNGKVDVNRIAQHFGGGGHKTASGITLRKTDIKDAQLRIISFIRKEVESSPST
jgi:phosphoesterase RecJ-like protein